TDAGEEPMAFAWVEPGREARYVVVRQHGYSEAYPVVADLPVRVVTSDVDLDRASATFAVSEHKARGRLLRRYRLRATVAGYEARPYGSSRMKVVPRPSLDTTSTRPPCACATPRVTASPRPEPCVARSSRTPGSKILSSSASGIPGPPSSTEIFTT